LRARKLAVDLGIPRVLAIANRVRPTTDLDAIQRQLGDIPLIGKLPQDDRLAQPVISHADGTIQPGPALREYLPAMEAIVARLRSKS
jgi:CO dehydrogenase nickel-insertion accessory protein CooC1